MSKAVALEFDVRRDVRHVIKTLIDSLDERMIERAELSRLIILTLASRSNLFLIGKPGVAKTYAVEILQHATEDMKYFEYLIIKGTKYEELFGTSREEENGVTVYNREDTVLDAHIAFIDEIWKGDSKTLNSFLPVTSRKRTYFQRGVGMIELELEAFFAASNEFPQDDVLAPFDDRFVVRYEVIRIQDEENLKRYFVGDYVQHMDFAYRMTRDDIAYISSMVPKIAFPDQLVDLYVRLSKTIINSGIDISDRKLGSAIDVFKASAFMNGRSQIDISDFFLLMHIGWKNFTQRTKLKEAIWNFIFGRKDAFESDLADTTTIFDENMSYYDVNLRHFVGYEAQFDQFKEEDEARFQSMLRDTKTVLGNMRVIIGRLEKIDAAHKGCLLYESLIENNIFLRGYKNHTFDETILRRNMELKKKAEAQAEQLTEFVSGVNSVSDYTQF
ncbi:AAA family ATPase [Thiomicrolovo sp. ZZH C-3]